MRWLVGVALGLALVAGCGQEFTTGDGGNGGSTAGTGGTSTGVPPACETPGECPPTGPCATPTCVNGTCGTENVPQGQPLPPENQVPGDCRWKICNGQGDEANNPDQQDEPHDGNACTNDYCDGSTPVNEPVAAGTPCSDGEPPLVCDGSGNCVGCNDKGDCPGEDTECQTPVCDSGTCYLDYEDMGTLLSMQAPGDCLSRVCDGLGGETEIANDNDVPPDAPHDCATPICVNGTPLYEPLADNTACGPSYTEVCCTGVCCAGGQSCVNGGCVSP